jgi:glutathione synthase/RimK-type ligase-like ATP-grasp enzyme
MNGESCKMVLSIIKEHKASIYIDEASCKKWNIKAGERITVIAGQRSISVEVHSFPSNQPNQECKLSTFASQYLSLPAFTTPISITFFRSIKKLVIGPFLAIIMNQPLLSNNTFGEMESFFQEMNTYCSKHGFPFYVTNLQTIQDDVITGYWPTDNGWESQKLPLANVFYNRIHSRQLEQSSYFTQFTTELQHYRIPMFNACFLSKFEVHTLLLKEESLHSYIPESIMLGHKDDVCAFIDAHLIVYVKPIFGSQGKHIGKVTKIAEGWLFEHSGSADDFYLAKTETELFTVLKKFCKNRTYMIQKGIPLLQWEHKQVDFRILLHQTKEADWKVTSIVARIGDTGHIVSNVARGAEMKNGIQFLKEHFDHSQALRLQQILIILAKKTAQQVASQQHGLFAELGIDLAFDQDLHPWIIEVNSKPSKKFEGHYERVRPSVKAIIQCMNMLYKKITSAAQ